MTIRLGAREIRKLARLIRGLDGDRLVTIELDNSNGIGQAVRAQLEADGEFVNITDYTVW